MSCGYGVPLLRYEGERDQLIDWAEREGPDGSSSTGTRRTPPASTASRVSAPTDCLMPADRIGRVRARMDELGVDVMLLSIGADLPVPHGLRGDAARTAHDAGPAARRRRHARRAAPRSAARRRAARRCSRSRPGTRPTTPSRRRRARRPGPRGRHRRSHVGAVPARAPAGAARARPSGGRARSRPVAHGEGPGARSRRCAAAARAVDAHRGRRCAPRTVRRPHRGSTCTASSSSACSTPGTSGRTSPSSARAQRGEPAPRAAATRVIEPTATSSCATSAAACDALLLRHHALVRRGRADAEVRDTYAVLVGAQEAGGAGRAVGTPGEEVDAAPGASSPTPASATGSSTAPGTASASRRTRSRTSSPATHAARARARVQRRARHLPARPLRAPARGHRRRDRRRARAAEPGPARPRRRGVAAGVRLDPGTFLLQWATGGLFFLG